MNQSIGYFSLLQYVPDPSRLEGANIGVLLFAPGFHFLKAMTSGDNRRITRFFGREGHDWLRINSMKKGIVERLDAETPRIRTLSELEKFIAERANQLRITHPRPMKIRDPDKDLRELFEELVEGKVRGNERQGFKAFLRQRFSEAGIDRKLATDIHVKVPTFGLDVAIPYGYQNGRFNLIKPAKFESKEASQAITTACRYAVEGQSLYQHQDPKYGDLKLIVVGQFSAKKANNRNLVEKILKEHQVGLYPFTEIERLIADIRENGKDIVAKA